MCEYIETILAETLDGIVTFFGLGFAESWVYYKGNKIQEWY